MRQTCQTIYHPVGHLPMGADDDVGGRPGAARARRRGPARGRRVGDAERAAREHQRAGDRDRRARGGPDPRARDAQRERGPSDGSVRLSRTGIARYAPIADWLPRYDRSMLRGDVLAGIAVAAMIVPKDLGYAGIAGIPVQNGLYAAAAGAIVYALFCTSRHISTGPSSSLAAVAGGAVLVAGVEAAQAAELVAAITLVTGALFLLLAVLRLGWIARFLSRAVVTGFLAGAAVDVVIGELPKLTGTDASGETAWGELASWIRSLGDVSGTTVLVGVVALAVILGLRFSAPRVPGALVLVVGGLLATPLFDLDAHGVALVGDVPRGLPTPVLPDVDVFTEHYATILAAAAGLLLIGFSQTAGDARAFAARHRYRIDVDQESVAQGMANVAAGAFRGMPVSTSLSASSLNESAGARTPLASLVTGGARAPDAHRARAAVLATCRRPCSARSSSTRSSSG